MIPEHVQRYLHEMHLEHSKWAKAHPYRAFWRRRTLPLRYAYREICFRLGVLIFGHDCES